MDFRSNPVGNERIGPFCFDALEPEAYLYLENSDAIFGTPIERLEKMNPLAIELYAKNGIDIKTEPLEVAVCAQHNNGGLAGDLWWESNIKHLFPIGEVNGSHGVYRPGGSALNSGQVASLRAAQKIAKGPAEQTTQFSEFEKTAQSKGKELISLIKKFAGSLKPENTAVNYRDELQQRMTNFGSHIRDAEKVKAVLRDAYEQMDRFEEQQISGLTDLPYVLQNRHLVTAQAAYLEAIRAYLDKGGGSRGSYMVMDKNGEPVLDSLGDEWRYKLENPELREWVLETVLDQSGRYVSNWKKRRQLPDEESWFENVWGKYLQGDIFKLESDI